MIIVEGCAACCLLPLSSIIHKCNRSTSTCMVFCCPATNKKRARQCAKGSSLLFYYAPVLLSCRNACCARQPAICFLFFAYLLSPEQARFRHHSITLRIRYHCAFLNHTITCYCHSELNTYPCVCLSGPFHFVHCISA